MDEEEVVRAWAEKEYPEYVSNLEAMKELFRAVNKGAISFDYVKTTISDIVDGRVSGNVVVRALVISVTRGTRQVCKQCRKGVKKGCGCGAGFDEIVVMSMKLADPTSTISATYFGDVDFVKAGVEVKAYGYVKQWNDKRELAIHSIERYDKVAAVNTVLRRLKDEGEMPMEVFEFLLDEQLLTFRAVEQYVDVIDIGGVEEVCLKKNVNV